MAAEPDFGRFAPFRYCAPEWGNYMQRAGGRQAGANEEEPTLSMEGVGS